MDELAPPRYVPEFIMGPPLGVWYDTQEEVYRVLCPRCRSVVVCKTIDVVYREMVISERKGCQGCRAKISFEKNPGLIGFILDFWCRTDSIPESTSWLGAIPKKQFILWAK